MPDNQNKKYFHELTQEEIQGLVESKKTWIDISENYLQPSWCNMANALHGKAGCWSLYDVFGKRKQISKSFCSTCDYFKK